jgi:hypothetical protein
MEYNTILGYKYLTEIEAINAVELCNQYYGIPVSPENETTTWITFEFSYGSPDFYFIWYNDTLPVVLGEPTELVVEITPPSGTTINV